MLVVVPATRTIIGDSHAQAKGEMLPQKTCGNAMLAQGKMMIGPQDCSHGSEPHLLRSCRCRAIQNCPSVGLHLNASRHCLSITECANFSMHAALLIKAAVCINIRIVIDVYMPSARHQQANFLKSDTKEKGLMQTRLSSKHDWLHFNEACQATHFELHLVWDANCHAEFELHSDEGQILAACMLCASVVA